MAARKDTRGSETFLLREEALFCSYHDTKGKINIAIGLYHIQLKPASLHLPSFKQVFLDLPLLQFACSKRLRATQKQEDGV